MRYISGRLCLVLFIFATVISAQSRNYGIGRTPTQGEIKSWDDSIGTDGKELPPGSGTAEEGAKIYVTKCVICHGANLNDGNGGPPLVGGQGTLTSLAPVKTIGSFWPFATTIWDFINRAMPAYAEGSLKPSEVYAVTAYLLYRNGIIRKTDFMNSETLPKVRMPNRTGFIPLWPAPRLPGAFGLYPQR
jgi:S-disulfanyl-L-cysteine oxidoreductase SoxD